MTWQTQIYYAIDLDDLADSDYVIDLGELADSDYATTDLNDWVDIDDCIYLRDQTYGEATDKDKQVEWLNFSYLRKLINLLVSYLGMVNISFPTWKVWFSWVQVDNLMFRITCLLSFQLVICLDCELIN